MHAFKFSAVAVDVAVTEVRVVDVATVVTEAVAVRVTRAAVIVTVMVVDG